jgi:diguanylate cyclase (GGDEF)-like protein
MHFNMVRLPSISNVKSLMRPLWFPLNLRSKRRPIFPGGQTPMLSQFALLFGSFLATASLSLHFFGTASPIWVSNAVAVAVLLRNPVGTWPLLLPAQFLADLLACTFLGDGFPISLGTSVYDIIEVFLVSTMLSRISSNISIFSSMRQAAQSALACILVPLIGATGGTALLTRAQENLSFFQIWTNWYLSAVFGFLIVTPFVLLWSDTSRTFSIPLRAKFEVGVLGILVGVVGAVDFGVQALPGLFLCFPFLLLAAFRGGLLGATTSAVTLTVVASGMTLSGQGPLAAIPATSIVGPLLMLQLYLAAVLLSTLPVAIMLEQKKLLSASQTLADLSRMARHDVLTGLPNRMLFQERLAWTQEQTQREGGHTALLLLDLDRFKPVNDLYGHAAGDRLLQLVTERLNTIARPADTVARLGGDEFAMIAHIDKPFTVQTIAQRVITTLSRSFEFRNLKVQIGCSVGIVLSPADGTEADLLLRRADAALYRAKGDGRNCFRFFEEGMDLVLRQRAELEAALRHAVVNDELVPYYQPIITMQTAELAGFEMLARWTHPTLGEVSPAVFVPSAESTGLIGALTERLLRYACRAALTWPAHLFVTVNISPVQLRDRGLADLVRSILKETGLPPLRLEIELTESALIDDFKLARDILVDLKATGVRLALDDFGTGYSSLRHLQGLPIDKIKIDMGFVQSMTSVVANRKIVAGVIGLGHSLGLPVVAEGIEDRSAAEALKLMGCDLGQGWLYGRAMPAEDVLAMLPHIAQMASGKQQHQLSSR